ncbi:hypothetical protein SDC9_198614 [bioreactor metagenome]|uniref:Uncharacterized protein n=1 Tax=bioreactor metagenome TaxID=1076179 RepID=A0A645IUY5_9ZZZZ
MLELAAAKKKRSQLLESNGFDREIARTELLIMLIQNNSNILEDYDENLFLQAVDKIIIHKNHTITFRIKNSLELTEYCGKEVDE